MAKSSSSAKQDHFNISDESKRVIEDILKSKDIDGSGDVDLDELEECLSAVGFQASFEDLKFLTKHLDKNGDGKLQIKEIIDQLDVINLHAEYGVELMAAFKKFDQNGDGYIRYPQMLKILTGKGPHQMEVADARKLLNDLAKSYDTDRDGKFSYSEFVKIFMSDKLPK
ncbi:DgyrCDS13212 [Dimorphilus gyrociliatus]|uniref:DgyrCDS13212 n=1 Tax=Dimorphilus gyrociliatus TaxID=2664684 RepID=A0A7I8WA26_9ANNE|nr:DgyrCDS13212 [Dimorphilus gyrociliatus]